MVHDDELHQHDAHDHHEHEQGEGEYASAIEASRADKDAYFKHAPGSPVPAVARQAFDGLPYFAVDPSLRFADLKLEPYAGNEPSSFQIPTSDGQLRPAHRAGMLTFKVDGEPHRLTAYVLDGSRGDQLFVPFLDLTSGRETYGAGRYLDLEPEEEETYLLDFNLAYHPYCVYADTYSCPLTPAENRLPVRIEAGERLAKDVSPD